MSRGAKCDISYCGRGARISRYSGGEGTAMLGRAPRRSDERRTIATPRAAARRVPLRRLLRLLRPYTPRLVGAALLLILANGLGLVFPLVIRNLLDTILVQRSQQLLN